MRVLTSLSVLFLLLFIIAPNVRATESYGPGTTQCGEAQEVCQEVSSLPFSTEPGSCQKRSCGMRSDDGCWCDDVCADMGDCCENVCDVCSNELSFCSEVESKGERISACAEAANPFLDSGVINEECHSCVVSEVASKKKAGTFCGNPLGCQGICGEFNDEGNCWCDEICFENGDCCPDVCTFCSELWPGGCPPNG